MDEVKKDLIKMFEIDLKKKQIPILYTVCKHVSSSGMLRHIDVFFIGKDRKPIYLNWYIEKLGLYKRAKDSQANNADSLRVNGCGMDMGFSVVYALGSTLKELTNYGIIVGRNGDKKPETESGYLLEQKWL